MDLTDLALYYIEGLPVNERYNLIDQINRCSCSIPSNIAEGSGKRTVNHFAEFLTTYNFYLQRSFLDLVFQKCLSVCVGLFVL